MLMSRRGGPARDAGMTIVELMIAVVITALVSVVINRVMVTASSALASASENSASSQQALRLVRHLTYDVAGASSMTVSDATATFASGACWSGASGSTIGYTSPTGAVSRPLITIQIATPQPGYDDTVWWAAQQRTVSYELRLAQGEATYEVWRSQCQAGELTDRPERLFPVGTGADAASVSGTSMIRCPGTAPVTATSGTPTGTQFPLTLGASVPSTVINPRVYNLWNARLRGPLVLAGASASVTVTGSDVQAQIATGRNRWVVAGDCSAGSNLVTGQPYVVVELPYLGAKDALQQMPLTVLRSRVAS